MLAAGDLHWARDLVDEAMRSDALALHSGALSYLGAGPVEDFVVYQPQGRETLYHEVV